MDIVVADIIGINLELIKKCATLLGALSCGLAVDPGSFHALAKEIFDLYVENYEWYYMPVTVHKILVHGAAIIQFGVLPIGMMSEEAQETRHKHFKDYRERHSYKASREATMRDVCHRLLATSDPYISSLRKERKRTNPKKPLTSAICRLLQHPEDASDDSEPDSE